MAEEKQDHRRVSAALPDDERPDSKCVCIFLLLLTACEFAIFSGYVAGKKVNMSELMAKDQDDEALQKYKASLLKNANAAKCKPLSFFLHFGVANFCRPVPDDPRHIIVESFTLDFGNGHAITIDPSDKSLLEKPFKIKEASTYRIKIKFYAQHEIVSGLKYMNFSYKHGIRGTDASFSYLTPLYDGACVSGQGRRDHWILWPEHGRLHAHYGGGNRPRRMVGTRQLHRQGFLSRHRLF